MLETDKSPGKPANIEVTKGFSGSRGESIQEKLSGNEISSSIYGRKRHELWELFKHPEFCENRNGGYLSAERAVERKSDLEESSKILHTDNISTLSDEK